MKISLLAIGLICFLLMAASAVSAKIITFNDLGGPEPGLGEIPVNYEGLSWGINTHWQHNYDQYYLDTYGITTGFMAGTTTIWAGAETTINFQVPGLSPISTAHFDFISAEIAGRYGSFPVLVRGLNLGPAEWAVMYEENINVTMSHQLYTFNFQGIQKLEVLSAGYPCLNFGCGSWVSMDNVNVNIVPEPISSILFVIGGSLLAGRRFIRQT